MKFIRDIIKEKRRTEAQDAHVAPLEKLRHERAEAAEASHGPASAFTMGGYDDDAFDMAPAATHDPEEDFDLFAADDEEDFEPWRPRKANVTPADAAPAEAPVPVSATFEDDDTYDENSLDDARADESFDDENVGYETSKDDPFDAVKFAVEHAVVDAAPEHAPFADGPLFEDDTPEDTAYADDKPAAPHRPGTSPTRDMVRDRAPDLPPMPEVTRAEPKPERTPLPAADTMPSPVAEAQVQMPPPAAGRGANRSGRVKTRLLGFTPGNETRDPFAAPESAQSEEFPVAWMVVVAGPGRGASFALHDGVSRVGRGEGQTVSLNFGDNSISRENHISIAYDAEDNTFYVGHSGKSNLVRLNRKPLLSTERLTSGDQIRLGETTLRFVALCGDGFSWESGDAGARRNAG